MRGALEIAAARPDGADGADGDVKFVRVRHGELNSKQRAWRERALAHPLCSMARTIS